MDHRIKALLYKIIFFIGWVLSPFTPWNDIFVNIPIAYFFSNIAVKIFSLDFFIYVVVFYWLSNIIGIAVMVISGRGIIKSGSNVFKEFLKIFAAMVAYTILLIVLNSMGILKPIVKV